MYATMAQFLIGFWFLLSMPRNPFMMFMGDNPLATSLLGFGILGALASIFLMFDALRKDDVRPAAFGVSTSRFDHLDHVHHAATSFATPISSPTSIPTSSPSKPNGRFCRCSWSSSSPE